MTAGADSSELPSPNHLLEKPPSESAVKIRYDFATDEKLREKYQNPYGYVRMGIILEDLDALAGTVAFNHCDDANPATRPLLLVTAAVDQITMLRPFRLTHEIEMAGQVREQWLAQLFSKLCRGSPYI